MRGGTRECGRGRRGEGQARNAGRGAGGRREHGFALGIQRGEAPPARAQPVLLLRRPESCGSLSLATPPPHADYLGGGCLEQPVREGPAVCLQIEVFSVSLRQPDWLLPEKEAFS